MKKIICILFFVVCMCNAGCAADLFYNGSITTDAITADVDIQDAASITLTYTLSNTGTGYQAVNVEYWQPSTPIYSGGAPVKNPLIFGAGEKKTLSVKYTADVKKYEPRVFTMDPTLLLDEKFYPEPIKEYAITITLPTGVKNILSTSKEFTSEGSTTGGRVWYKWRSQNEYPTMLTIKWSSLALDLNISKSVSSWIITDQYRDLIIDIVVENRGDTEGNNISLSDNYDPTDFVAIEPLAEFFTPELNNSDPRLIWRKNLGTIVPGEMKKVSYSVRYIGDISQTVKIKLSPTVLYLNDTLVGISNTVTIGLVAPTPVISTQTTTPLNIGVIVFAIVIVALVYPRMRNRKRP